VEINGFDFDNPEIKVKTKDLDWHKWVYGSYANPNT
jgi:hypothetical protein